MNLVDSQQARRVLDRLVGYKISPILARKLAPSGNKTGMSAGRVQSAALKMIVDRENEIRAFVPEEYWTIFAELFKEGDRHVKSNLIKAAFNDFDGEKTKITNAEAASALTARMKGAAYFVDEVKKGVSTAKPAPPFTTSTMQQEANHKLNMSADRAIRVAQQLYEGVNVGGEGLHALITYIRTDSVRVSPDFAAAALGFIRSNYGAEYAPSTPNVYKTSASAQDAHEAIRPISLERTPQSLEGKLERDQFRLYKLIYERFLASQMKPALYNTMRVHIAGQDDLGRMGFVVHGRSVKFKGFTAVYSATADKEKEDEDVELDTMPDLNEGDRLDLENVSSEQKFTKPPARYTDASLVKAMEENGIGRPSTYASIISVLAKREYTEKEGKSIKPTQRGEKVCEYMVKNFPNDSDEYKNVLNRFKRKKLENDLGFAFLLKFNQEFLTDDMNRVLEIIQMNNSQDLTKKEQVYEDIYNFNTDTKELVNSFQEFMKNRYPMTRFMNLDASLYLASHCGVISILQNYIDEIDNKELSSKI